MDLVRRSRSRSRSKDNGNIKLRKINSSISSIAREIDNAKGEKSEQSIIAKFLKNVPTKDKYLEDVTREERKESKTANNEQIKSQINNEKREKKLPETGTGDSSDDENNAGRKPGKNRSEKSGKKDKKRTKENKKANLSAKSFTGRIVIPQSYMEIGEKTMSVLRNTPIPPLLDIKSGDIKKFIRAEFNEITLNKIDLRKGSIVIDLETRGKKPQTYMITIMHNMQFVHIYAEQKNRLPLEHVSVLAAYTTMGMSALAQTKSYVDVISTLPVICVILEELRHYFLQVKNQRDFLLIPRDMLENNRSRKLGESKLKSLSYNMIFARLMQMRSRCKYRRMCRENHNVLAQMSDYEINQCSLCWNTFNKIEDDHTQHIRDKFRPSTHDMRLVKEAAKKVISKFIEISYFPSRKEPASLVENYFNLTDKDISRVFDVRKVMSLFGQDAFWNTANDNDWEAGEFTSVLEKVNMAISSFSPLSLVCDCGTIVNKKHPTVKKIMRELREENKSVFAKSPSRPAAVESQAISPG